MSLKDQIEDARRAISGPVYYHYPPGASEALEVVCKSDYDALAARLAEAEAAAKTWENEAERRSRRYEKAAVRLAEAEELYRDRARRHEADVVRLAEAAVKVNNVAECLAYGMDRDECIEEIRLVARSMGYVSAFSADEVQR